MTFANTYIYSDRSIFDLKTLLEAIRFIVVNSIWIPIHLLWLWLGISLKKWSLAVNKQIWVNRGMGLALFAVVVLSAFMELNSEI